MRGGPWEAAAKKREVREVFKTFCEESVNKEVNTQPVVLVACLRSHIELSALFAAVGFSSSGYNPRPPNTFAQDLSRWPWTLGSRSSPM